jgi:hypothetical protein
MKYWLTVKCTEKHVHKVHCHGRNFCEAACDCEVKNLISYSTGEIYLVLEAFQITDTSWEVYVGVWFSVSELKITECIFFLDTINSDILSGKILVPFFANLSEVEEEYEFCQQDGSTALSQ